MMTYIYPRALSRLIIFSLSWDLPALSPTPLYDLISSIILSIVSASDSIGVTHGLQPIDL